MSFSTLPLVWVLGCRFFCFVGVFFYINMVGLFVMEEVKSRCRGVQGFGSQRKSRRERFGTNSA